MEQDTEILRVASVTKVAELAGKISYLIYDSKTVVLRAIGHGAVGQAVKAVAVARGMVAPRGISLGIVPGFVTIEMPDRETTGMELTVIRIS